MYEKFGSRKFIVTMYAMTLSFILALYGFLDTVSAGVLTAGIFAYNIANVAKEKYFNEKSKGDSEDD